MKVTKVVKTEGKPDGMQLQVSPAEIACAHLFEVSQKIQSAILGDGSEDRVAAIHDHFYAYNEEYDYEQPAAMAETRRRSRLYPIERRETRLTANPNGHTHEARPSR